METWHDRSTEETITRLGADPLRGLDHEEAVRRLAANGPNKLLEKKKKGFLRRFLSQFADTLIYILLAAAVISAFLGEISDAIIILVVVLINAVVGVVQEARAEKAIEALKKLSAPRALVVRGGSRLEIPSEDIVVGDTIVVDAGRIVPCDLRWVEAVNLKVEEAALTGESVPVDKDASALVGEGAPLGDRVNMGYLSTFIAFGRGVGIATATGMSTEIGRIAAMLDEAPEELTPLQRKLDVFGRRLGAIILGLCGLMFVLAVGEELLHAGAIARGTLFELFLTSVSLAVAAIPEGLPAIVTIVLAIGVQLMSREKAIVRRLPAVETLGSVTMICSDKTGTLTRNRMSVVAWDADGAQGGDGAGGYGRSGEAGVIDIARPGQRLFLEALSLCNDAELGAPGQASCEGRGATGDPTEIALLEFADSKGICRGTMLARSPRVGEFPFDSDRKMMSTVHAVDGRRLVMTKGAADRLLERCDRIMMNGEEAPLDATRKAAVIASADAMAERALRVLGAACRTLDQGEAASGEGLERGLVFLGMAGMIDPPRIEVRDSIALCRTSGIGVAMITGDHKATALAIARDLDIASSAEEALAGPEIDALDEAALAERAKTVRVFARVSPEHKVRIVRAFRANGHIVSMTGDGINDAPSLKAADIGVAMGITGTDVAKGASDMILADDNFGTIVRAIEEGRNIYRNIRKAILYLLSCNAGEILAVFSAVMLQSPIPLLPIHILWVNLVTDTFPALALGMDPGDPDVIKEQPRDPKESLFARGGSAFIMLNGLVIGGLTIAAFRIGMALHGGQGEAHLAIGRTMAFAVLSLSQLFHAFNLRHFSKSVFSLPSRNPWLFGAFAMGLALQASVILVPGAAAFFKVHSLSLQEWAIVAALSLAPLVANELFKLARRIVTALRRA